MATYAQRRRARIERMRQGPPVDDADNRHRKYDAERQMKIFDQLPTEVRQRLAAGSVDFDAVELFRRFQRIGPSKRVLGLVKERNLLPSDVPIEELFALELAGR